MSPSGDADAFSVLVRAALLDALEALGAHREAVIVIGAQAIYLHTGAAQVAVAEYTKDSDLAIDPRMLGDTPLVEHAMTNGGFRRVADAQPGAWLSPSGIPVDLMVPEALAGGGPRGARGARIPPHDRRATRRAIGLEAAVVDAAPMLVTALDPADGRCFTARVAGPAALLVAKLHKIGERVGTRRLGDKDAHDVYRLLTAVPTATIATGMAALDDDTVSRDVARLAVEHLRELFGSPGALGSQMAGRVEEGIGDPEQVAVAVTLLVGDLVSALRT